MPVVSRWLLPREQGNRERGTGNGEQGTGNREQGAGGRGARSRDRGAVEQGARAGQEVRGVDMSDVHPHDVPLCPGGGYGAGRWQLLRIARDMQHRADIGGCGGERKARTRRAWVHCHAQRPIPLIRRLRSGACILRDGRMATQVCWPTSASSSLLFFGGPNPPCAPPPRTSHGCAGAEGPAS